MRLGTRWSLGLALALAAAVVWWLLATRGAAPEVPQGAGTESRASTGSTAPLESSAANGAPATRERTSTTALREELAAPTWALAGRLLATPSLRPEEGRIAVYRAAPTDRAIEPASFFRDASLKTHPALVASGRRGAAPSTERLLASSPLLADGSFAFRELRARDVQVVFEHPHLALENECFVHVAPGESNHDLGLLRTRAGACVHGRVEPTPSERVHLVLMAEVDPFAMAQDRGAMASLLSGASSPEVESGPDGRFVMRAVPATPSAQVFLSHPTLEGTSERFALVVGETREIVVRARLGASVAVTVRDEAGAPLPGARVTAARSDVRGELVEARARRSELTDSRGVATLVPLPSVPHEFVVRADGYRAERRSLTPTTQGANALTFTLTRGLSIAGFVVDAGGAPIAGAQVAAEPAVEIPFVGDLGTLGGDLFAGQVAREGRLTSGPDGRFVLSGFETDALLTVVAARQGYLPGSQSKVQAGAQDVRIVLRRGGNIVGKVVVPESGPTEVRLETVVTFALVMQRPTRTLVVPSDAPRFELTGIPPGAATLRIAGEGLATFERAVQVEDEATLDVGTLELLRAATVAGRVVAPDGTPVAGATVQRKRGGIADNPMLAAMTGEHSVTTGNDGTFLFRGLAPGKHTLSASAEGHAPGKSARFELAAGQELRGIEIRLARGGTIAGKVELGAGETASDFQVTASTNGGTTFGTGKCDAEGRFRIEHLEPGRYDVQAIDLATMERASANARHSVRPGKSPDFASLFEAIGERTLHAKCSVKDGETTEVVLDGRELGRSGLTIAGKVALGAQPLADGMVELALLAEGEPAVRRLVAIRDGRYAAHGLTEGTWRLQVHRGATLAPVGEARTITLAKGNPKSECDLALPAGALRGTVRRAGESAGLAGALVRLVRAGAADADTMGTGFTMTDGRGTFTFEGLGAGTYDLIADDELFRTQKEGRAGRLEGIVLAEGQVHEGLVLEARSAAGLVVEVATPSGEPAAFATCVVVDADGRALGLTATTLTDARGVAHFAGVAAGRVRVLARDERHAPAASAELQVVAGQETKVALSLAVGTPTSLRVEDRNGRRLANVRVALRREGLPWIPHQLLVRGVDAQDGYDLGMLPPGPLELRLEHPELGTQVVTRTIPAGARARLVAGR